MNNRAVESEPNSGKDSASEKMHRGGERDSSVIESRPSSRANSSNQYSSRQSLANSASNKHTLVRVTIKQVKRGDNLFRVVQFTEVLATDEYKRTTERLGTASGMQSRGIFSDRKLVEEEKVDESKVSKSFGSKLATVTRVEPIAKTGGQTRQLLKTERLTKIMTKLVQELFTSIQTSIDSIDAIDFTLRNVVAVFQQQQQQLQQRTPFCALSAQNSRTFAAADSSATD